MTPFQALFIGVWSKVFRALDFAGTLGVDFKPGKLILKHVLLNKIYTWTSKLPRTIGLPQNEEWRGHHFGQLPGSSPQLQEKPPGCGDVVPMVC